MRKKFEGQRELMCAYELTIPRDQLPGLETKETGKLGESAAKGQDDMEDRD